MSKRIIVHLIARDPSDVPDYIKAVNAACPPKASLELKIECTLEASASAPQRVDETLETAINHDLSERLDQLAALAQAVREHQAEQQRMAGIEQILERAGRVAKTREWVRRWFTETALAAWQATIRVVVEVLLREHK